MSEVSRFEAGEHWRDSREKLNQIVDALNALRRIEGDEIVGVSREGDNLLLDMSIDQISARLPRRQFLYAKIVAPLSLDGVKYGNGWVRGAGDDTVVNETFVVCSGQRCDSDGNVQSSEVIPLLYYHSVATDPNIRVDDVVPYDDLNRHIMGHYNDDKIYTVKMWLAADDDKEIPAGWEEVWQLDGRVPVGPGGEPGDHGEEIDSMVFSHSGGSTGFSLQHTHGLSDENHEQFNAYDAGVIKHIKTVVSPTSLPNPACVDTLEPPFYTVRFIKRVD